MEPAAGTVLLHEIETLLRTDDPTLAHLEDTLTEGYAKALALEAERLRLERRVGEVVREVDAHTGVGVTAELSELAKRLRRADDELAELRAVLESLNDRVRSVRVAGR